MPKDSLAMIELGYNEAKAVVVLTVTHWPQILPYC